MAWLNSVEHFLGYHEECVQHKQTNYVWKTGVDYPEAAVQLFIVLESKVGDFDLVNHNGNTQKNESFHQVQLCYGSKNIRFPRSQTTRDMLAVLRYNEGMSFELELRKRLQLEPLDTENNKIIQKMSTDLAEEAEIRKTPEYRTKKFCYRKMKASKNKKQKGDYKPSEEESSDE